jgi:hypothetical protein
VRPLLMSRTVRLWVPGSMATTSLPTRTSSAKVVREALRGLHQQRRPFSDVPADVVRHSAVREGDVLITFQDDDLRGLGQSAGAGGGGHPSGHTTDDDDLPGFTHLFSR